MAPQDGHFLLYMKILIHHDTMYLIISTDEKEVSLEKTIEAFFWSNALFWGLMDQKIDGSWNLESLIDFSFNPWLLAEKRKLILWKPRQFIYLCLRFIGSEHPKMDFSRFVSKFPCTYNILWLTITTNQKKNCRQTKTLVWCPILGVDGSENGPILKFEFCCQFPF